MRPANFRTQVALFAARKGGKFVRIGSPRTNASGYFKLRVRRGQAAKLRYRTTWASPNGETFPSRTAAAGRKIGYLKFREKKKKNLNAVPTRTGPSTRPLS